MKVIETTIADVKIIEAQVFGDERGFFLETFRASWFKANIADVDFVQDNHSKSSVGTLRGLHYQIKRPQGKLVRVTAGEVFDVVVDLRQSSPTFGKWEGHYLSAENKRQLWLPTGFAHGYYVTSKDAEFVYKCTDYYAPQFEKSLLWNDQQLEIEWPILAGTRPLLSAKDITAKPFNQSEYFP